MTRRRLKRPSFVTVIFLIALTTAYLGLSPGPSNAQGFFDLFRNSPNRTNVLEPDFSIPVTGPIVAYCVRLCDGRYFPMSKDIGNPHSTPEKLCRAFCPGSATRVFTGGQIEQSRASNGDLHSKLQNALLYRERIVSGCSCIEGDGIGIAAIDARNDPTLRSGDIVVTAEGPLVFSGKGRMPYQPHDFSAAKHHPALTTVLRRQLSDMRISHPGSTKPSSKSVSVAGSAIATSPLVLTVNPLAISTSTP